MPKAAADVPARLRAIREATGLTQEQFRAVLARAGLDISQSQLSRLENGGEVPDLDELAAYAAVDPLQRGRLWLAWGDDLQEGRAPTKSGGAAAPRGPLPREEDLQRPLHPAPPAKRRRAR